LLLNFVFFGLKPCFILSPSQFVIPNIVNIENANFLKIVTGSCCGGESHAGRAEKARENLQVRKRGKIPRIAPSNRFDCRWWEGEKRGNL
jgi:hypothetical protein